MRTKISIGTLLILLLLIFLFIANKSKSLTYSEFINEFIEGDIVKIVVTTRSDIQNGEYSVVIEDSVFIDKIINEPSMQLKRRKNYSSPDIETMTNKLTTFTQNGSKSFYFGEGFIETYKYKYSIKKEPKSPSLPLYDLIKYGKFQWKKE